MALWLCPVVSLDEVDEVVGGRRNILEDNQNEFENRIWNETYMNWIIQTRRNKWIAQSGWFFLKTDFFAVLVFWTTAATKHDKKPHSDTETGLHLKVY